jgi:putative oxidoreductase
MSGLASGKSEVPLGPAAQTGNTSFAVSIALLMLRLVLGWAFIYHGMELTMGAFGGPGIAGFAESLSKQPLPGILSPTGWAYVAAYGELLGGMSVFAGLLARLGAIPIIATMLVAIMNVHAPHGFSSQHGGYEYNLLIIAVCTAIIVAGPGLISVDAIIFRRGFWARGPQPLGNPSPRGTS